MSSTVDWKEKEAEDIWNFKFDNFIKILGPNWPLDDIHALIESDIYYGDLQKLLDDGCSKETAIRILL